jgi:hypothetical protein
MPEGRDPCFGAAQDGHGQDRKSEAEAHLCGLLPVIRRGAADWQRDAAIAADVTLDALFRRAFRIFADRTAVTWENWQRRCRSRSSRRHV